MATVGLYYVTVQCTELDTASKQANGRTFIHTCKVNASSRSSALSLGAGDARARYNHHGATTFIKAKGTSAVKIA